MLEKAFKLKRNNTTVRKELLAGLTTFMAMSYAIFVVPSILSSTGMDYTSVYGATIIATILGTLLLGLVANVPYAQSVGIGTASLFTYTICFQLGFTWQEALAMLFISSLINITIAFTNIRTLIIKSIPDFIQEAITVGIGLFIAYIGLINAGIITFIDTPRLSDFSSPSVILALIGIVITSVLVVRKVKGAYLIGIILTTLIGIPMGVTGVPDFSHYFIIPNLDATILKMDFSGLLSIKSSLVIVLMTVFTLCISDLFDSIGVFIGTGKKSGIFKLNKNGKIPRKLEVAIIADTLGLIIAPVLGTSTTTTYVESSSGIESGGRTGLTSVFVALCFLFSLALAPIVKCVPMAAISPVLILVGASMLENIDKIDFKDITIAIPAFFVIIMMPLGYSISAGIQFGFIMYVVTRLVSGKKDEISIMMYVFSLLFIVQYIFNAIL